MRSVSIAADSTPAGIAMKEKFLGDLDRRYVKRDDAGERPIKERGERRESEEFRKRRYRNEENRGSHREYGEQEQFARPGAKDRPAGPDR